MNPKVSLISHTPDPLALMCYARRVMHSKVPDTLEELKKNPKKWLGCSIPEYFRDILKKDGMPTFLEYVTLTFKFENVSRALTHQLVRHRIGFSFSQQSLRCVTLENFADNRAYHNPYVPDTAAYDKYHVKMLEIQEIYGEAIVHDMAMQNARGLLPMNIQTTITFSCTLRALIGMVNKRLCHKTQGEFSQVAALVVEEIAKVMPEVTSWFGKPCEHGKCMMEAENEQQIAEKKFSGIQNTDHVCFRYLEMKDD